MGSDEGMIQETPHGEHEEIAVSRQKHQDISQIERVMSDASDLKKDHTVCHTG